MNNILTVLKTLILRVLVSPQIGLGHLIRCQGLAQVMRSRGWRIHWLINQEGADYFQSLGLPGELSVLSNSNEFEGEKPVWLDYIKGFCSDPVIVLDGYLFNADYLSGIRSLHLRWVLFEDLVLEGYLGADLLVNSSVIANADDYAGRGVGIALLGPEYAPVRLEFSQQVTLPLWERPHFLVMFGGSDVLGLTRQFVVAIKALGWPKDIPVILVTGAAYSERLQIEALLASWPNQITYMHNVKNMADLMHGARLALTAAGSTVLELAVMRVPSILLIAAENQEKAAFEMAARGLCDTFDGRIPLNWPELLDLCCQNWNTPLPNPANTLAPWCDGLGLMRIADAIENL